MIEICKLIYHIKTSLVSCRQFNEETQMSVILSQVAPSKDLEATRAIKDHRSAFSQMAAPLSVVAKTGQDLVKIKQVVAYEIRATLDPGVQLAQYRLEAHCL